MSIEDNNSGTGARLTLQEAAARSGLSVATLRRHIHDGALPAVKTGSRYEVTVADLDAMRVAFRQAQENSDAVARAEQKAWVERSVADAPPMTREQVGIIISSFESVLARAESGDGTETGAPAENLAAVPADLPETRLSLRDAAAHTGLSVAVLRRHIHEGTLSSTKKGNRYEITVADLVNAIPAIIHQHDAGASDVLEDAAKSAAAADPPLTDEQRSRLTSLLKGARP